MTKKNAIESMMIRVGWLTKIQPYKLDITRLVTVHKTRHRWSTIVQEQRTRILTEKFSRMPEMDAHGQRVHPLRSTPNIVAEVSSDFFRYDFKASNEDVQLTIDNISHNFKLNTEQDRAYRLLANHAVEQQSNRLDMYIGGMGGSGKSQVFKAMIEFFRRRKEDYRFLFLGPTGSSAALLNGSTYHMVFGIRQTTSSNAGDIGGIYNEAAAISKVTERLRGVEYILLDEISMCSCNDLQLIASQAAKARNVHDIPFGGINMIYAGDFAQLPPTGGTRLFNGSLPLTTANVNQLSVQNAILGRGLWHRVTTVVMLRKNMRQQQQTEEDHKFRTALTNMRYGACTPDDIQWLRSRIAGSSPHAPQLTDPLVRNVSIITALNAQKDTINELGGKHFSSDTDQELVDFYAIDRISTKSPSVGRKKKGEPYPWRTLLQNTKDALWDAGPATSDHIAGKLSLCVGLPVLIRYNEATELCITKGQEAIVRGWDDSVGPDGKRVLDTLFVELMHPPKDVHLQDLPINVVPLTRSVNTISCYLPNDMVVIVDREQVQVLPIFSMTDYSSQGKSRNPNVVELNNCRTHQSYYTALSRGTCAEGTVIIQGFNASVITSGIDGFLRQEFRDLETLDEITLMRYEGKIPNNVKGQFRIPFIQSYRKWCNKSHLSDNLHPAIGWKPEDDLRFTEDISYEKWRRSGADKNVADDFHLSQIDNTSQIDKKRKRDSGSVELVDIPAEYKSAPCKKQKYQLTNSSASPSMPLGIIWDGTDYSCPYDSYFVILWNLWSDDPIRLTTRFKKLGRVPEILAVQFGKTLLTQISIETARDVTRKTLHSIQPLFFPYRHTYSGVDRVASVFLAESDDWITGYNLCKKCGYLSSEAVEQWQSMIYIDRAQSLNRKHPAGALISQWLTNRFSRKMSHCPMCLSDGHRYKMKLQTAVRRVPYILCFIVSNSTLLFDPILRYTYNNRQYSLKIRGIIYHGESHFTSRIITQDGQVWHHDGINTGRACSYEGTLHSLTASHALNTSRGKVATAVIYARSD